MNHTRILRRSLEITWLYRALWVFGITLAVTAARGGGNGGGASHGSGGSSFTAPAGVASIAALQYFDPNTQGVANNLSVANTLGVGNAAQAAAIIAILVGAALLLAVIFTAARVVAETALIRMVNDYEGEGTRLSAVQGFRLGWSRRALRVFLIDLLVFVAAALVFLVVFAIAAAPLAGLLSNSDLLKTVGTVSGAGLLMLAFTLFILAIIVLSILIPFFHRACVLEDRGVIESLRQGWAVARRRVGDVVIMALLLLCLGLVLAVLFIPLILMLGLGGAVLGGLPGALAGLISSLFLHGTAPVVVGLAVALPILLLVILIPLVFVGGLAQVFTSSAWTLTYREILALDTAPAVSPAG